MPSAKLKKTERLTGGVNLKHLLREGEKFRTGKPFSADWLSLTKLPNGLPYTRFGCVIRREVTSGGVFRNQLKRWLREAYRRNKKAFPSGVDLLAVVFHPPMRPTFQVVQQELLMLSNRSA